MPFITQTRRTDFDGFGLDELADRIQELRDTGQLTAGDLAYIAYRLLKAAAPEGSRFEHRNAMMGAVDEARLTYRRLIHDPAEDEARRRNGDIA